MIRKLFGETDSEQFRYLVPRISALGIGIILLLIGALLGNTGILIGYKIAYAGEIVSIIALLVFGWSVMSGIFGYATVFALFSNNMVIGILIFLLFLFCGVYVGLVVSLIGICKFISLLINKNRSTN